MEVYGLGSILTSKIHRGNGYSFELIKRCINLIPSNNTIIFLYSDLNPIFYEKLGFRILSNKLQKYDSSVCMAYCKNDIWDRLLSTKVDVIPNYF
jgi:predicted acetyltransferase